MAPQCCQHVLIYIIPAGGEARRTIYRFICVAVQITWPAWERFMTPPRLTRLSPAGLVAVSYHFLVQFRVLLHTSYNDVTQLARERFGVTLVAMMAARQKQGKGESHYLHRVYCPSLGFSTGEGSASERGKQRVPLRLNASTQWQRGGESVGTHARRPRMAWLATLSAPLVLRRSGTSSTYDTS